MEYPCPTNGRTGCRCAHVMGRPMGFRRRGAVVPVVGPPCTALGRLMALPAFQGRRLLAPSGGGGHSVSTLAGPGPLSCEACLPAPQKARLQVHGRFSWRPSISPRSSSAISNAVLAPQRPPSTRLALVVKQLPDCSPSQAYRDITSPVQHQHFQIAAVLSVPVTAELAARQQITSTSSPSALPNRHAGFLQWRQ